VPPAEENWTSRGWIGVAPKSKIMGTTFSFGEHRRFPADPPRFGAWGIVYAYENGALVWSYSYASAISYLRPFVDSAYSRGTLVTNAFGNAFHPGFDFPPNGISCQMLTQEGTFYPNHPLNSSLEILTPSVFGSSNAAPSVAGVLVLGREVRAIVNERLESGTHNRLLDATQLPSGVYFYRLEAGAFMDTKKLVISK
jgi:hypothetical protein